MDFDIGKLIGKITWNGARNVLIIIVVLAAAGVAIYKVFKPEDKKASSSHDINISSSMGGATKVDSSIIINGDVNKSKMDSNKNDETAK